MSERTFTDASLSRRATLALGATAAGSALAGCLDAAPGFGDDDSDDTTGMAAFFALYDWARNVAGDAAAIETPIETGEMGHGWDPSGDLVPEIAGSDLFVYLGTPEFQWVLNLVEDLAIDHEDDVHLVDAMDAIPRNDLRSFDSPVHGPGREPDPADEFDPDTFSVGEFDVFVGDERVAWWHDGHWHGGIPEIPLAESIQLELVVTDPEGRIPPLGQDEPFQFDARLADGAPTDVLGIDSDGATVTLTGQETAQTLLVLELRSGSDVIFETAPDPLTVSVVAPADIEVTAFHDPHVWVDPVLAQEMVSHIADELAAVDPDNTDTYQSNATAYRDRLAEIDHAFQELVADAQLDTAVLAGHASYRYVEARYGFELQTPVGVTPDAVESIEDVTGLADTIETYDIDTVLYDPFEAPDPDTDHPQAVTLLLENTSATEAAPLTPIEGTTPTWQDNDWGWIEQMEEINLPSLRAALKA